MNFHVLATNWFHDVAIVSKHDWRFFRLLTSFLVVVGLKTFTSSLETEKKSSRDPNRKVDDKRVAEQCQTRSAIMENTKLLSARPTTMRKKVFHDIFMNIQSFKCFLDLTLKVR